MLESLDVLLSNYDDLLLFFFKLCHLGTLPIKRTSLFLQASTDCYILALG